MIEKELPHRVVGSILNSLADIPKNISESVSSALDKAPLGEKGPHRGIDSIVKSVFSSIQAVGEGIAKALDKPIEGFRR